MRKLSDDELCRLMVQTADIGRDIGPDVSRVAWFGDFGDGYIARVSVSVFSQEKWDAMTKETATAAS